MSRYDVMFRRLRAAGEGAFVPFTVLGDPTPEVSWEHLVAMVEGGADALELGIPFSDPVADGPTIQAAGQRALGNGVRPSDSLALVQRLRGRYPELPVGLLVYANLVVSDGMERFYGRVSRAGVDSVLVADVPSLEAAPFCAAATAMGVDPVLIAPPDAPRRALDTIARLGRGYTYVVTRAGVTGANERLTLRHRALLAGLEERRAPPPILGFGISRPAHVRAALRGGAAGAISGSAVVALVARYTNRAPAKVRSFVSAMKAATLEGGMRCAGSGEIPTPGS